MAQAEIHSQGRSILKLRLIAIICALAFIPAFMYGCTVVWAPVCAVIVVLNFNKTIRSIAETRLLHAKDIVRTATFCSLTSVAGPLLVLFIGAIFDFLNKDWWQTGFVNLDLVYVVIARFVTSLPARDWNIYQELFFETYLLQAMIAVILFFFGTRHIDAFSEKVLYGPAPPDLEFQYSEPVGIFHLLTGLLVTFCFFPLFLLFIASLNIALASASNEVNAALLLVAFGILGITLPLYTNFAGVALDRARGVRRGYMNDRLGR